MNVFLTMHQFSHELEKRTKEKATGHYEPKKIYFKEEDSSVSNFEIKPEVQQKTDNILERNLIAGGRCLLQLLFVIVCFALLILLLLL